VGARDLRGFRAAGGPRLPSQDVTRTRDLGTAPAPPGRGHLINCPANRGSCGSYPVDSQVGAAAARGGSDVTRLGPGSRPRWRPERSLRRGRERGRARRRPRRPPRRVGGARLPEPAERRGCPRRRRLRRIGHRRQRHERRDGVQAPAGLGRQPGLAHSPGAGQRDQAPGRQVLPYAGHVTVAADEAGQGVRHPTGTGAGRRYHGSFGRNKGRITGGGGCLGYGGRAPPRPSVSADRPVPAGQRGPRRAGRRAMRGPGGRRRAPRPGGRPCRGHA
jgi:hypothetical protein